jgi:chromate transport protein ChrA
MIFVAWKVFTGSNAGALDWLTLVIAGVSFIALFLNVPAPIVLIIAGLAGVFLFR